MDRRPNCRKKAVFKFLRPNVDGALISIDFYDFDLCIFSLVLVSIEKTYQIPKTVLDHVFKHRRSSSQNVPLRVASYFPLSSVFDTVVRHGLLCLIHYFTSIYG